VPAAGFDPSAGTTGLPYDARVTAITLLALTSVALLWGILSYNLLVRDHHRVAQSWSDVGVQLARRHDLIPKLVEVVQRHAGYERSVLEDVTALRARGMHESSPAALGAIEGRLGAGLQRLVALAEAYPELKASASFVDLMRNLTDTENQLQFARRYYNGAVNNLNTRVATFPDLIVARLLRFAPAEYFEFES
jgi:LemA protein